MNFVHSAESRSFISWKLLLYRLINDISFSLLHVVSTHWWKRKRINAARQWMWRIRWNDHISRGVSRMHWFLLMHNTLLNLMTVASCLNRPRCLFCCTTLLILSPCVYMSLALIRTSMVCMVLYVVAWTISRHLLYSGLFSKQKFCRRGKSQISKN